MTPLQEAERILALANNDVLRALEVVERQLNALYLRAQVLMSLSGVVITVTGFSGRIIAGTSLTAKALIVAGLSLVLISAVWIYIRVMSLRWVTSGLDLDNLRAVEKTIKRRNRKTKAYTIGGFILSAGLTLYVASISIMLLNPD